MTDSSAALSRLKRRLERLEQHRRPVPCGMFALGCDTLDRRLGGGLARGALHEICAIPRDQPSAAGFALMLALRASAERPILWVREDRGQRHHGQLYGPGLAELGARPEDIILVNAPDTLSVLRAGADIVSCTALGAAIIEPHGAASALDLTASRKLVLATQNSGLPGFILREGESRFASAAATRWHVRPAPSSRLPANAPGGATLALDLVRHRGGIPPFSLTLEWDRDTRAFAEPALSRPVLSPVERRQMAA